MGGPKRVRRLYGPADICGCLSLGGQQDVERQIIDTGPVGGLDGGGRVPDGVPPSEAAQRVIVRRLHAERNAVAAGLVKGAENIFEMLGRVGLQGDLGVLQAEALPRGGDEAVDA